MKNVIASLAFQGAEARQPKLEYAVDAIGMAIE